MIQSFNAYACVNCKSLLFLSPHFICFYVYSLSFERLGNGVSRLGDALVDNKSLKELRWVCWLMMIGLLVVALATLHITSLPLFISLNSTDMTKLGLRGLARGLVDNTTLETLRYVR